MFKARHVNASMIISYAVFGLVIWLLQTTFVQTFAIGNITPLLLISAAASAGVWEGKNFGAFFGGALGFVFDATVGTFWGYYALLLLGVGYLAGLLSETSFGQGIGTVALAYVGGNLARFFLAVFLCVFNGFDTFAWQLLHGVLQMLYSAFWAIPVYFLCVLVHTRFCEDKL